MDEKDFGPERGIPPIERERRGPTLGEQAVEPRRLSGSSASARRVPQLVGRAPEADQGILLVTDVLGMATAVVTACRHRREVLAAAGLDGLFDAHVDGVDAAGLGSAAALSAGGADVVVGDLSDVQVVGVRGRGR